MLLSYLNPLLAIEKKSTVKQLQVRTLLLEMALKITFIFVSLLFGFPL